MFSIFSGPVFKGFTSEWTWGGWCGTSLLYLIDCSCMCILREFCYASQKRVKAQELLHMLEDVGSVDPQVAQLLLRQCCSFCKMVHLARSTPPSPMADALQMFDNDIHEAFAECTAVDAFGNSWELAQLSLSRGGLGLRSLSHHFRSSLHFICKCIRTVCSVHDTPAYFIKPLQCTHSIC